MADGKPGRRPYGARAMTPAERKARSRALALGGVVGHLDQADASLGRVKALATRASPQLLEALIDLELHLGLARSLLPKS